MIRSKDITQRLKDIGDFLLEQYKGSREEKKRDWRTYEQKLMLRIKRAIGNLKPLIHEAVYAIDVHRGRGRRPGLSLEQKIILLLLKELFDRSNRNMSGMLAVFSVLSNIDVSYKTIERLYSDPEVEMAIHNLHVLLLKKAGVEDADVSGDGTGYALTIKKHYATEAEKRKDKAKEAGTYTREREMGKKEKRAFVYAFNLLDLRTRMYVSYGMSFRSEKEAFENAVERLKQLGVEPGSVRLDRYYGFPSYVDRFGEAKVYVFPRKNATMKGSWKWKLTMKEFVKNTISYLREYYLRNHSEAGFSVDKRWFGWKIAQRRGDRILTAYACSVLWLTAYACSVLWHNLFNLYSV